MLAVWYPTELLRGVQGPTDPYFVILVSVLFVLAVACIGRGLRLRARGPRARKPRR